MLRLNNGSPLRFPPHIKKQGLRITKDEAGDSIIILTKRNRADHIYPMSDDRFGVWLTAKRPKHLLDKLQTVCPSYKLEQQGDDELIVSFLYSDIESASKILRPARKRQISQDRAGHLKSISPFSSNNTPHTGRLTRPNEDEPRQEAS